MKADIIHGRLVVTPESISEETLLNDWRREALTDEYFNEDRNQKVYRIGEYSIECRTLPTPSAHKREQS